ncbi:hypothetical protein KPATCC21470_4545 [Kitasatospora purpeofusca]
MDNRAPTSVRVASARLPRLSVEYVRLSSATGSGAAELGGQPRRRPRSEEPDVRAGALDPGGGYR